MALPYFTEYEPLLNKTVLPSFRRGVALASTGFAFDRFFLGKIDLHETLFAYVQSLCAAAHATGKQPVIKFARSQGRLPWFVQNFPGYQHALLIRQPWNQFRSGWRCLVEDKNAYFLAVPFVVLERNAAHPDVEPLIRALGLPIVPVLQEQPMRRLKFWLGKIWSIDAKTSYKASFALWLLSIVSAVPAATLLLDGDATSAEMAASFDLDIGKTIRPATTRLSSRPDLNLLEIRSCHETARAACAAVINPAVNVRIEEWLHAAETAAAADLGGPVQLPSTLHAPNLLQRAAEAVRVRVAL
jgi:hypothetical protein